MIARDLRRALGYVAPYWRSLVVVVFLSLLGTLLGLFVPYLSKVLIDNALVGRDPGVLTQVVLGFAGLSLASFALNVLSGLRYVRVSADILFDMRLDLFQQLQRLSPRFYATIPIGQIAARINSDIAEIQRVAAEIALAWVGNVLFLVGTILILWQLDPVLFGISLGMLPFAVWALVRYQSQLDSAMTGLRDRSAEVGSFLIESLLGMKLVVSLNAQEREILRFRDRNTAFIGALMRMRTLAYMAGGLPGLLLGAGSAAVFYFGGQRVINETITIGTLVAFVAYQMRLIGPIEALMGLYTSYTSARVSLRRVHEIFDAPVDVVEATNAQALPKVRGEVALDGVTFTFGRGAPVLDNVTLTIAAGERVAVVGRSGEGKSTIADLIVRQLDPASGRILLDGHDVRQLKLDDVRRHVVVVDQEPFVFNTSVLENLRYARPNATEAEALDAVNAAGLGDLISRMPHGIQTSVGERGRMLSAGERQRLAVARALLADPAVLVLDEATGSLDPATEAYVVAGYEAAMRGRTTIMITHRIELARRAQRVVVLDRGRIVEEGSVDSLLARDAAFAGLFNAVSAD